MRVAKMLVVGVGWLAGVVVGATPQEAVDAVLTNIDISAGRVRTFQARFVQTTRSPALGEKDVASGVMYMVKKPAAEVGHAPTILLRFDYKEPEPSVMIMNEAQVIFQKPGLEAEVHPLVDDLKTDALVAGFTSTERLRQHFVVKLGRETATRVTLILMPMSEIACRTFRELRITFNRGTWLPVAVYQHKTNDERITFEFEEIKVNYTIAPELFTVRSVTERRRGGR
ncbi:MAG: outer membrane lipoprotein carrier protein LolA [bacterium]|nr:outer membrane lipoprotein carrier protein LolA [bacterium]